MLGHSLWFVCVVSVVNKSFAWLKFSKRAVSAITKKAKHVIQMLIFAINVKKADIIDITMYLLT